MNQKQQEKAQIARRGRHENRSALLWTLALIGAPILALFILVHLSASAFITLIATLFAFMGVLLAMSLSSTKYTGRTDQMKQNLLTTYGVSTLATVIAQRALKDEDGRYSHELNITWTIPGAANNPSIWATTPNNNLTDFDLYPINTRISVLYDPDDPANYSIRW